MRVRLGTHDRSAGIAGDRPTGIRTADLHTCSRMQYHSTSRSGNTYPPRCLKPSLPLKNPNCVFLSARLLA